MKYTGPLYLITYGKIKLKRDLISEVITKVRGWYNHREEYKKLVSNGLQVFKDSISYPGKIDGTLFLIPAGTVFDIEIRGNRLRLAATKKNNPTGPYGFKIIVSGNKLLEEVEEL